MEINREKAYEELCGMFASLRAGKALTVGEKGCLAMAVNALRGKRETEIFFAGMRRSVEEGKLSDACFRALKWAREDYLSRHGDGADPIVERVYAMFRDEWMKDRLDSWTLTSDVREYPEFFLEQMKNSGDTQSEGV